MSFSSYLPSYKRSESNPASESDITPVEKLGSPLPLFPEGAEIGHVFNCYSEPLAHEYKVRDVNYLNDKKKAPSGPFICQLLGVDLFLTKAYPENIGRNPHLMGGKLQQQPSTFIFNFRVPWGVLVFYSEIPSRFLPFLRKGNNPSYQENNLPPLETMSPSDRALCRFLIGDDEARNEVLKIIPVIVKGPSIVRKTINSTPALIAKKLPVKYFYHSPSQDQQEYFEIDFDIAASSFAKSLLSMVRGNTKSIVFDLGFVIQGNHHDELPEQMLLSARIHGLDPAVASDFPC